MGGKLFAILGTVIVLGVAAYFIFPGFREKVDDVYDKNFGWTAEARRKDPVGFIEYSIKKLGKNVEKFEDTRGELRAAQSKLQQMKEENTAKSSFAEKNLEAFKAAYKDAKGGKGWPTSVAGKSYTEAELKSQVGVVLSQKGGYEGILKQIEAGLVSAERRQNELMNRVNDSKAKLGILEAQKTLVKVNQLSAESEKLLAEVNDVLIQNEAMNEKSSVRTVEELMRDAGETPGASNPNVDAFLNG